MEFPRRIITSTHFWHMAQYYERSGKFATTSPRYISVVFRLGAQVSRELIILCTNLTVRLNSNTQLEHCDSSLIDVLHWCTVIYK